MVCCTSSADDGRDGAHIDAGSDTGVGAGGDGDGGGYLAGGAGTGGDNSGGRSTGGGGADGGGGPADADLFVADYSSLDGNWFFRDTENEGITFTIQRVSMGGPGGRDAIDLLQTPLPNGPYGQYGWGHRHQIPGFTGDMSRFFRWRMRMDPSNNYRALNWSPPGEPAHSSDKLVAMGESAGRYITNIEAEVDGNWRLVSNVDGGGDQCETALLDNGTWYSVQIEYRYGSSATVKIWIDSDDYTSPSAQTQATNRPAPENAGNFSFGAFNNVGLAADGVFAFRHADFRVATTFDSSWHASMN
jgi:hypothetical protein